MHADKKLLILKQWNKKVQQNFLYVGYIEIVFERNLTNIAPNLFLQMLIIKKSPRNING